MQMNRRAFLVTGAALAVVPSSLAIEGCSVNIKALLNVVIESALAVAKVAEANAPWLPGLQSAIAALQAAEQNWTTGTPGAIVIDCLNTLEAVLAVIPMTMAFSPLIAVIVAGIEAVMAAFGVTLTVHQAARVARNPYKGAAHLNKPHAFQTYQGAYRSQFNDEAKGLGLTAAEI